MDPRAATRDRLRHDLARSEAELARLETDHAHLIQAARASNADDEHDPEGATLAFEREQLASLVTRLDRTVDDLRRALADVDGDRYGVCDGCGRPIDPARLEARPQARLCLACARGAQRDHRRR